MQLVSQHCWKTSFKNSDIARFITHIKPVCLIAGGKTRNIAFQLFLQQCYKTSFTFSSRGDSAYERGGDARRLA